MDEVSMNLTHSDPQPSTSSIDNLELDQVFKLVETLYNPKNPNEQAEANRRLIEIQASEKAWEICWPLLDINRCRSIEVHFFAANALVQRINQSWSQQNEKWLKDELRPKLFDTLLKYASSPDAGKLVIERLSLALATFALHSIPTFWPDAIEDILKTFTPQNLSLNIAPRRICDILLKILMYIPEEYSVLMPQQDHRAKLNSQITKSCPIVFKFLFSLLEADESAVSQDCKQNVLQCFTSWTMHSKSSLLETESGDIYLNRLYDLISNDNLCGLACTALAATFGNQKADNYRNTVINFIPKIANLKPIIDKYMEEEEVECAIKIYSLVINFSENHSRLFLRIILADGVELESPQKTEMIKQSIFSTIKIILDCTSAPGIFGVDERYSDTSFSFWFTFLENFYYYPDPFNDLLCETFDPLVDSLLKTLIVKSRYPSTENYYKVWNDDQRESYRCYRQDIADNISILINFPRSRDRILEQLTNSLVQEFNIMMQINNSNNGVGGYSENWQGFESIVFAIKSIGEAIAFDEVKFMPKIFTILAQVRLHQYPPLLYCTVAEMISSYSDWLFTNNTHLAIAFEILFFGVTSMDSHVRLMSTLSLKDLTTECQTVLQPYSKQIVESCTKAIVQPNCILASNEKARLMHTIGTTLAVCSNEFISQSLNLLTVPLICELASKAPSDPNLDPTCRPIIFEKLSMLNSLIESLYVKEYSGTDYDENDENDSRLFDHSKLFNETGDSEIIQPSLNLLRQLVPILIVIAEKYRRDEEIMELLSVTIKRSCKSLGIEVKPLVKDFLVILVTAYDPIYNSNMLEGCVPLYNLFKVDQSLYDYLRDAFTRINEKTIEVCMANPLQQLSVTIENYFRYSTLICKKFPEFLTDKASSSNIELVYKLAIASLELPERRTLSEVCNFLSQFRSKCIGDTHLQSIFNNSLSMMVCNIFNIFGGNYSTPRNAVDQVTDLFFAITESQECQGPLKMIVEKESFPTNHVNRDTKARFVSRILHERNRKKFKDACSEFVMLARNLNRTA